jgi:hypothetical protein
VSVEAALVECAVVRVVAICAVNATVIDGDVNTAVCVIEADVRRATAVVIALARVVATTGNVNSVAPIVDACFCCANVAVVTVVTTDAAIVDRVVGARVCRGVARGRDAVLWSVAVAALETAVLSRRIYTFVVFTGGDDADVAVGALAAVRVATAHDGRELALVRGHVAQRVKAHIVLIAVLLRRATVVDGDVLALALLVAVIVGAHVAVGAVLVRLTTAWNLIVHTLIRLQIASALCARVHERTVLCFKTAELDRVVIALVVHAEVVRANVAIVALI